MTFGLGIQIGTVLPSPWLETSRRCLSAVCTAEHNHHLNQNYCMIRPLRVLPKTMQTSIPTSSSKTLKGKVCLVIR